MDSLDDAPMGALNLPGITMPPQGFGEAALRPPAFAPPAFTPPSPPASPPAAPAATPAAAPITAPAAPPVSAPASAPAPAAAPGHIPAPGEVVGAPPPPAPLLAAHVGALEADEFTSAARETADPDLLDALQAVLLNGASDLHISVNNAPMLRVDGSLRHLGEQPWDRPKVESALRSVLSPQQAAIFEEKLELDFAFTLSANARFRVNFYMQRGAMGAAFRIIPTEIKQLSQLGVPDVVAEFSKLPRGLVLVTGPTGSGKSTTLAAMIDLVNQTRTDHIVTVEDPIEFIHRNKLSLVNQREVGHDTHSFGNALKHVLRQDPDVILIGELRDLETISVALTAAETGHLVFATLHTQDAAQTIDRVIDVFPPHQQGQVRTQLAATLQGVVCQTLVKRSSGHGRAVATEVMVTTPAIANLIREGKTYQVRSALQAGRGSGMHTMDQHLADLVNTGQVTYGAALEKSQDIEDFNRLVHRKDDTVGGLAMEFAGQI